MEKNELKAEIARHNDRQEDLAAAIGISPASLSARMNGEIDFKRTEVEAIAVRYDLSAEGIQRIFFAKTIKN